MTLERTEGGPFMLMKAVEPGPPGPEPLAGGDTALGEAAPGRAVEAGTVVPPECTGTTPGVAGVVCWGPSEEGGPSSPRDDMTS